MRLGIVWMFGHPRSQRQVPRHLLAFGLVPKTQVRPALVPMALKKNPCLDTSNQGLLVGLPHLSQLLLVLSQSPWGHPWLHRVACIWWCPGRGLDKAVWCPQEPSRPTSALYLRFVRACTTVPGFYSTPLWYHCIHIIFIASYFCWLLFLCGVMWFSICWDLFLVQSVTKMSQITQKRHPDLTNRISHGGHIGGCFVACRLCWLQAPGHTKGHLPCEPRR